MLLENIGTSVLVSKNQVSCVINVVYGINLDKIYFSTSNET